MVIILSFLTLKSFYSPVELRGVADSAGEGDRDHDHGAGDTSDGGHSPGDKGVEAGGVPSLS